MLLLLKLLSLAYVTGGFVISSRLGRHHHAAKIASSTAAFSSAVIEPPTWEELEKLAPQKESKATSKLTLFRDTNGWCPFCERVWAALEVKGIPYDEVTVSLQNKPQWYKNLVPSKLVPAVELHDCASFQVGVPGSSERGLVAESADILKLLDDEFPDTVRLSTGSDVELKAVASVEALLSSSFKYSYSVRNASLSLDDKAQRKAEFLSCLDDVEALFSSGGGGGGPFLAGDAVSVADLMAIPMLERYRYQLRFLAGADAPDLYASYPGLAAWFDAMDATEGFSRRVAGDAYSWTAVTSTFLRLFAKDSTPPEVLAAADAAAEALLLDAAASATLPSHTSASSPLPAVDAAAALEAARKLLANHAAIVGDATREDPQSQKHLPRVAHDGVSNGKAQVAASVDALLRATAASLLHQATGACTAGAAASAAAAAARPPAPADATARAAARLIASRLCAPRDMGAPAAAVLRASLMATATSA